MHMSLVLSVTLAALIEAGTSVNRSTPPPTPGKAPTLPPLLFQEHGMTNITKAP